MSTQFRSSTVSFSVGSKVLVPGSTSLSPKDVYEKDTPSRPPVLRLGSVDRVRFDTTLCESSTSECKGVGFV